MRNGQSFNEFMIAFRKYLLDNNLIADPTKCVYINEDLMEEYNKGSSVEESFNNLFKKENK